MSERISYEAWVAVDQTFARRMAHDPEVRPIKLRIMFAAIGWANLIGHANFAPGGLAFLLAKIDPTTGALAIPSAPHVANEIKATRDQGLIGPDSDAACLTAPEWWMKNGGRGGRTCQHHRITAPRRHARARP